MSLAIICCRSLEPEIKSITQDVPEVSHLEIMSWELHIEPERLLETISERIWNLQNHVDAVMLGYGRCQTFDRLPNDFKVPIFRPDADDCIGVLLGQKRYEEELQKEAGTWFFTQGWTEMGMEFIFHELQISRIADKFIAKGKDPMELARRMLKDYTRGLFIEMKVGDQTALQKKAREISNQFQLRFEKTKGSLATLEDTLHQALLKIAPKRKHRIQ